MGNFKNIRYFTPSVFEQKKDVKTQLLNLNVLFFVSI